MKDWESVIIGPETTVEQAIGVIDRAALRIALVADDERRLMGTVTDGDIRRALLAHKSLQAPVREVMNANPRVASQASDRKSLLGLMERHGLLQLPLVDQSSRLVGLETLHDVLRPTRRENPVFLMAGGFGRRLRPLTDDIPKPMLKIGDKPILEQILESFIEEGFHRFFISTHYKAEMIREYFGDGRDWGVSIEHVHEEAPLGTAGALGLLPGQAIDSPLLMMNGDLLTNVDFGRLLEFHQDNGGQATMCVREYEQQVPYGVIEAEEHRITSIVEKPVQKYFVNAGIYVLEPELVKSMKEKHPRDMPDLLQEQIGRDAGVNMFPIHEYWLDIGRMEDFRRAQAEYQEIFHAQ